MIRELREQLAADLRAVEGGPTVEAEYPARLTPPILYVQPPETEYILSGKAFGEYAVSMDVVIVIRDRDLAELERLIEGVLANTVDWALLGVDAPEAITANNIAYFGTTVHLSKAARPSSP